jgi:hypothetical protein
VVGLVDGAGTLGATITYDAWGNASSVSAADAGTLSLYLWTGQVFDDPTQNST